MSLPSSAPPLSAQEAAPITNLASRSPHETIIINEAVRGSGNVEVCSTVAGQRQCIRISQDVTKVFALMQSIGTHFCTLPQDPAHTEIECQPLSRLMR